MPRGPVQLEQATLHGHVVEPRALDGVVVRRVGPRLGGLVCRLIDALRLPVVVAERRAPVRFAMREGA